MSLPRPHTLPTHQLFRRHDELTPALDCGMAYSVTYTFAPPGKGGAAAALQKRVSEQCPPNKMKCNTMDKVGFECIDANTSTGK